MAPFRPAPRLPADKLESLAEHIINPPPTPTLKQVSAALFRRQSAPTATVTVKSDSGGGGGASTLSGGAIAGIVIGSIAGFLLLWWIVRSCCLNLGAPPDPAHRDAAPWYGDGDRCSSPASRRPSRSRSHNHHHHHHRKSSSEVRHLRPVAVVGGEPQHQLHTRPAPPAYVYERDGRDVRRGRRERRSRSRYE